MLINIRDVKKEDRLIEVIATDIADLAMMGFGSVENCRSVYNALIEKYTHVNFNIIRTKSDLENIVYRKPDLVFTGIKYVIFNGVEITKNREDKIWISEYMEEANINYTGSGKDAIELEFCKNEAKIRVKEFGINTPPYFVAEPGTYKSANEFPIKFPLFIKPLCEGDSKGIGSDSVVYDFESYKEKIQNIYALFKQSALVEKFISGREFTVSILGSDSNGEPIAMPVEIIVSDNKSGKNILGYKTKRENKEKAIVIDDKNIYESVVAIAKNAFMALGARDYGRIDILMDDHKCPYFLEANLVPGMTRRPRDIDCSYFARTCFINTNIAYQETIHKIAEIAFNRIERNLTPSKVE
jgi:D-alanine-D-alanine ligase